MEDTLLVLAGRLPRQRRDLALDICVEVIAIAPELPGGHPGRAARSAVMLLLELAMPELPVADRRNLAHAAERAVVMSH